MLAKREKHVLGVSKELPEGIFGLLKTLAPSSRVRTKVKTSKALKARRAFNSGATSAAAAAEGGLVKTRLKVKHTPKTAGLAETKPKIKTKTRRFEEDNLLDGRIMPGLDMSHARLIPREAKGLDLSNVVSIPEEMLELISNKTQLNTQELSDLMLLNTAPAVLSFDAASSYVGTVLNDGLGIEVDIDRGVLEVVKDLSRMDVVFFFLKRLALPLTFKKKFMHTFSEDLAHQSLASMQKTNRSESMSQHLRELEGVLVKRSEHNNNKAVSNRRTRSSPNGGMEERQTDLSTINSLRQQQGIQGVKRSRTGAPNQQHRNNSPTGL